MKATDSLTIYHNARCSKSRDVCAILEKKKIRPEVIEYMKIPPSAKEIKALLKMLGIKAEALVRKKEPLFLERYEGKKLTESQWIKAMVENPVLIERPILVRNGKAIIGRPPEIVLDFLKK